MVLRSRLIFLMISLPLIITAGCGGVGDSSTPPPPLTLIPFPTPFISGNCDITSDLETWVQMADLRVHQYLEIISATERKSREEIWADANEMGQILQVVSSMGAPACAEQAQAEMIGAMQAATNEFQLYVNQQRDDLKQITLEANQKFVLVSQLLETLKGEIEERYRNPS